MQLIKGSSSHLINHLAPISNTPRDLFEWQAEYGVLTFSDEILDDVVEYVDNQEMHHSMGTLRPIYEQTDRDRP
jgi:hypothetical protein